MPTQLEFFQKDLRNRLMTSKTAELSPAEVDSIVRSESRKFFNEQTGERIRQKKQQAEISSQLLADIDTPEPAARTPIPTSDKILPEVGALEAGGRRFAEAVGLAGAGVNQLLGLEENAETLRKWSEAFARPATRFQPDVGRIEDVQNLEDFGAFVKDMFLQSVPDLAAGLGGALAGTALTGTPVGGALLGGAAVLPAFAGRNIQRQMQEQGVKLRDANIALAAGAAVPQAALDSLLNVFFAGKIFGPALKTAKGAIGRTLVTMLEGAATETLTETAQQAIEIGQAAPEKLFEMSPEIQSELLNAAVGGGILGGLVGAGAQVGQELRGVEPTPTPEPTPEPVAEPAAVPRIPEDVFAERGRVIPAGFTEEPGAAPTTEPVGIEELQTVLERTKAPADKAELEKIPTVGLQGMLRTFSNRLDQGKLTEVGRKNLNTIASILRERAGKEGVEGKVKVKEKEPKKVTPETKEALRKERERKAQFKVKKDLQDEVAKFETEKDKNVDRLKMVNDRLKKSAQLLKSPEISTERKAEIREGVKDLKAEKKRLLARNKDIARLLKKRKEKIKQVGKPSIPKKKAKEKFEQILKRGREIQAKKDAPIKAKKKAKKLADEVESLLKKREGLADEQSSLVSEMSYTKEDHPEYIRAKKRLKSVEKLLKKVDKKLSALSKEMLEVRAELKPKPKVKRAKPFSRLEGFTKIERAMLPKLVRSLAASIESRMKEEGRHGDLTTSGLVLSEYINSFGLVHPITGKPIGRLTLKNLVESTLDKMALNGLISVARGKLGKRTIVSLYTISNKIDANLEEHIVDKDTHALWDINSNEIAIDSKRFKSQGKKVSIASEIAAFRKEAITELGRKEYDRRIRVWKNMGRIFKRRVVLAFGPKLLLANGYFNFRSPSVIYVSPQAFLSNTHYMTTLIHEYVHTMAHFNPSLWSDLIKQLRTMARFDDWRTEYNEHSTMPQDTLGAEEEMVAHFIDKYALTHDFWNELANDNPSLFRRFVRSIFKFLQRLPIVRNERWRQVDDWVDNIDAFKAAIMEAIKTSIGTVEGVTGPRSIRSGIHLDVIENAANPSVGIKNIIAAGGSPVALRNNIKKLYDIDIPLSDISNMKKDLKKGKTIQLSPYLLDSAAKKAKEVAKPTEGDIDENLEAEQVDVKPDDLNDIMGRSEGVKEKAVDKVSGLWEKFKDMVASIDLAHNFLLRRDDTRPIIERVTETFMKQLKTTKKIDDMYDDAIKPSNPKLLGKILVESEGKDVDVAKVIEAQIDKGKMTEKDLDAYMAIKAINQEIKNQYINELIRSRSGSRVREVGRRYLVKYVNAKGKVVQGWFTEKRMPELSRRSNFTILDTKTKYMITGKNLRTGKNITEPIFVDSIEEAKKYAERVNEKLIDEILAVKNWISHARRKGKYWVNIMREGTEKNKRHPIFSARVETRAHAESVKKQLMAKGFNANDVEIKLHDKTKKFVSPMSSLMDTVAAMEAYGIDSDSAEGQKMIEAYRSMSTLYSSMIRRKEIPGWDTDYKSILQNVYEIASAGARREFRNNIKDVRFQYVDKGKLESGTGKEVLSDYLSALSEPDAPLNNQINRVLDSAKAWTYFTLLANKSTYVIQNITEPMWAMLRIPISKLKAPSKLLSPTPKAWGNLHNRAKDEGLLRDLFAAEFAKTSSALRKLDFLGRASERASSHMVFSIGLQAANAENIHAKTMQEFRDGNLFDEEGNKVTDTKRAEEISADRAYNFAAQFLLNTGKPFYHQANAPIFALKSKLVRRYGFLLTRWMWDWYSKLFGASKMATIGNLAKMGTAWVLLAGVANVPFGEDLLKKTKFKRKLFRNPKRLSMMDRMLIGGIGGLMGIDTRFLIPAVTARGAAELAGMNRAFGILYSKAKQAESDSKKYGMYGLVGNLPLAGGQHLIKGYHQSQRGIVQLRGGRARTIFRPDDTDKVLVTLGIPLTGVSRTYRKRNSRINDSVWKGRRRAWKKIKRNIKDLF